MSIQKLKKIFCGMSVFLLVSCSGSGGGTEVDDYVTDFYKGDLSTMDDRIGSYPIDQQWVIFKYGSNNFQPGIEPLEGIARAGKPLLLYILNDIKSSTNDFDIVDSLGIANYMQRYKYYLVCDDAEILNEVIQNKNRIKNNDTRETYQIILGFLLEQCV